MLILFLVQFTKSVKKKLSFCTKILSAIKVKRLPILLSVPILFEVKISIQLYLPVQSVFVVLGMYDFCCCLAKGENSQLSGKEVDRTAQDVSHINSQVSALFFLSLLLPSSNLLKRSKEEGALIKSWLLILSSKGKLNTK